VKVSEPNAAEATIILRGLSAVYEQSHGVLIDDEAAAATLSERYLSGRQLPDKAIDVLDTACARVAINLSSPPKQISALTTLCLQCEAEIVSLSVKSISACAQIPSGWRRSAHSMKPHRLSFWR
jgi:type VI secretion system protein VasG